VTQTTIPGFLTGVLAVATAGMPTAVVHDGPEPTDAVPDAELFIGMRRFEDEDLPEAITDGEQQFVVTNLGKDERYRVRCLAVGRAGSDNLSSARARAFGLVEELGILLRADPTAGAVAGVIYCDLEVRDMDQGYTEEDGAVCRIQFDIRVRARI
jgi:hypothetical protein